eukprot:1335310-Amorphochlora_amoeboformis.AAC.1
MDRVDNLKGIHPEGPHILRRIGGEGMRVSGSDSDYFLVLGSCESGLGWVLRGVSGVILSLGSLGGLWQEVGVGVGVGLRNDFDFLSDGFKA